MACPSDYPIDTNTDCQERVCDTYCYGGPSVVYMTTKTHYYDRCKNSSGTTVCNYSHTTSSSTCVACAGNGS